MRRTPSAPSRRWIASQSVPMWAPARAARASSVSVVGGVRAGRSAGWMRMAPGRLAAMLAQERAGGGIEEADVHAVPLDRDVAADPARRRGVVGVLDLDAAVEMDGAGAELVVAKRLDRQRPQGRPLLGEHGGDLALGGAVDARVGPAGLPAVEVGLRRRRASRSAGP